MATMLFTFAFAVALFGLLLFAVWMNPVVSIDAVTVSAATTDVAVRLERRWFRLMPDTYRNGTVSVSCAGGAVTARGELRDVTLTAAASPSVATATREAASPTSSGGGERCAWT
uniref:Late embryogenesis abundant protein LEA-2 subgroup domain-containing protein n=1 Tax=Leersia perrieri TaxID=77586 RepID=A0A0D9XKV7_9ORYZ